MMNIVISLTILTIGILIGRLISHFIYLEECDYYYECFEQIKSEAYDIMNESSTVAMQISAEKIVKLCIEGKE